MPRIRKKTAPGNPRCAVAYLRRSKENVDAANGLEAQREAITRWAASRDVEVVAWHVDDGVSGSTAPADRPGLLDALAAVRARGAGLLVAHKRDRVARDVGAAAAVELLCKEAGASVVTADGVDASDTPEAALMRGILDTFAQYELALIRARTRAALSAKRKRGEKLGGHCPFGYRAVKTLDGKLMLRPLESEQSTLRRMRALREKGMTFAQIAGELEAGNYASRGKRWHASSVLRALRAAQLTAATG